MAHTLLLLLLLAPPTRAYDDDPCVDGFGRPGLQKRVNTCQTNGICLAYLAWWCKATPQPPLRVADGEWRCDDDKYELAGAKFSWPGGRAHIEPAECAPRALPSKPPARLPEVDLPIASAPSTLSLTDLAPPDQ